MNEEQAHDLYTQIKYNKVQFDEPKHCAMILLVMSSKEKGTHSAFCVKARIGEATFYRWLRKSEVFQECYAIGKMFSREAWEDQGRDLLEKQHMPGTINHDFEYWRMMGWTRFGIGKNSRIRLNLTPDGTPNQHYAELIKQASEGDFTAGEIKQLMEAINVGLNTHQVFALQKELDQIKLDLATMDENSNGNNSFTDKGITKKD